MIEVKSTKGRIQYKNNAIHINGKPLLKDPIKQTQGEQYWLRNKLQEHFIKDFTVIALLNFPNGDIDTTTIHGPIRENLWVGGRDFHQYLFKNSSDYLTAEEISGISIFLSSLKL